jgi:hypothetical protein
MTEQTVFEQALSLLEATIRIGAGEEERVHFPLDWLNDLSTDQARALSHLWRRLPVEARRDLMARMHEEMRENFELDFAAIGRFALGDEDAEVRVHAVGTLWECSDSKLADRFIHLLESDPEPAVRACAADALGSFVEQAEFEEIPAEFGLRIRQRLVVVIHGSDELDVRRRAVESMGYSSAPEVRKIVAQAYRDPGESMRASALIAMGRTADLEWSEPVLKELRSASPMLRAEAARAAGGLALRKSIPVLIELLEDVEPLVRRNAIGSLGEIGGKPARRALMQLERNAGEEEIAWIEDALDNIEFQDSLGDLPLMDVQTGEEEEGEEEEEEGEEEQEEQDDDE